MLAEVPNTTILGDKIPDNRNETGKKEFKTHKGDVTIYSQSLRKMYNKYIHKILLHLTLIQDVNQLEKTKTSISAIHVLEKIILFIALIVIKFSVTAMDIWPIILLNIYLIIHYFLSNLVDRFYFNNCVS